MDKLISISFEDNQQNIKTEPGRKLLDICDEFNSPILFGCRACSCSTCLIEVLQGSENLSPITESEQVLLSVMAEDNNQARLACQCIVNGSISIRNLETN